MKKEHAAGGGQSAAGASVTEARPDWLVGTGATGAERALGYGGAFVLAALIVLSDQRANMPIASSLWQLVLLFVFAYEIAGGAVANMLNACKRQYHWTPPRDTGWLGRAMRDARIFTLLHVHPVLIALAFSGSLRNAVIWYCALQGAVWITLAVPLYLRRALATFFAMVALVVVYGWLPLGAGLEWVIPALFVKLVMGHAVYEEAYGPQSQVAPRHSELLR